jgi:chloride channel protein, CIC family
VINSLLKSVKNFWQSKKLASSAINPRYALTEACIIGLVSGIAALLLKYGINWVGSFRVQIAHQWGAAIALPLMGIILGFASGWVTQEFSPPAAGSGIPQVKAALARFPIHLSFKLALVKAISTILALGSGLTLGRRGPTVHIGAALAAQLSDWMPTSPEHRRQMIAAGAAAGLAAGFNTPIAGVLFVVEELMRDVSGLTLETAIMASFTGAVVSRVLDSGHFSLFSGVLETTLPLVVNISSDFKSSFSAVEIPFYMLLGVIAGLLGALFNQGILWCLRFNRSLRLSLAWRISLGGLISGGIIACLPPLFWDNTGLRQFLMQGEVNWQITAIALIAHFTLTLIAYSTGAPGGIFAPALVLGSSLGYLVGMGEGIFLDFASFNTFALAGMGAFFTGVIRVPVTAIVIIFEMTADFNLVLPLMISCAIAYIVAEGISKGSLYQHLLKDSGIFLTEDQTNNNNFLTQLKASNVMQNQVEVLESNLTLDEVLEAMSQSNHRGFPVVESGILIGIVTQTDLDKTNKNMGKTPLKDFMTTDPITVKPDVPLSDVLYLLNRYQLSRLPVVESAKLLGIITRTDIIRAEVQQLSGQSFPMSSIESPSYIAYQTRSPAIGKGRILLLIAQDDDLKEIGQISSAIAHYYDYELDCLAVVEVSKNKRPEHTKINILRLRKIMAQLERMARHDQLFINTEIKLCHNQQTGILETIQQRHIKLVIAQWNVSATLFTVIQKISCELLLIKPGIKKHFSQKHLSQGQWLIPTAGGGNVQRGLDLLPALSQLYEDPQALTLWLAQVYTVETSQQAYQNLLAEVENLRKKIELLVLPLALQSNSVSEAIIKFAKRKNCDVIMLGASEESFLKHAIHGNIPQAIMKEVDATVILFREAS